MGQIATVKAVLTGSTMLASLNAALSAAGLATIGTTNGIATSSRHLLTYDALPAMAVDVVRVAPTDQHSYPAIGIIADLQVLLAIADDTLADMTATAEAYADVVRATCAAALATAYPLARWTGSDVAGTPFTTQAGLPALLLTIDFEVRFHADIAATA